jgi:adenosylhomocysteine nucleosidase
MIAILVAVKEELRPILRRATADDVVRQSHLDFHEGTLGGQPVALLALGVGRECARVAAEMTIRCYRPDLIISAGFGGSLSPDVRAGEIVVGTEIAEVTKDLGSELCWQKTDVSLAIPETDHNVGNVRVHCGMLLSTEEMVLRAATKARLGKITGALAVDMETAAVARVAAAYNTRLMAVRCISDNHNENLPDEFNDFFVMGQLQPGRIISACASSPRVMLSLARLGYRANVAGTHLALYLEALMPRLHSPTTPTPSTR